MATAMAWAQPAPVKKAAQGVFTLTTFNKDGTIHASSHGVFTGNNGEAIAMWHPFDGAQRAVVVDAKGTEHEVDALLGASELYDVCRFRVKGSAPYALPMVNADAAVSSAYVVDYDLKKPVLKKVTPVRAEKFMTTNNYYVFNDVDVSGTDLGCPLVNDAGQLLGLMQRPEQGGQAFSPDARLTTTFKISGFTINDKTLRTCGIRVALPDDEEQATLMLMLAGQQGDSAKYDAYIDDFIRLFPTSSEGYTQKAQRLVGQKRLAEADEVLKQSVKKSAKKDEAYEAYARIVYQAAVYRVDTTFTQWTLQQALSLSEEASKVNPLPIYKHQQAQIIYAMGDYQKALGMFTELQGTELGKNGEVYFEAAQCKTMLKAPQAEVMQLLDTAVNVQPGVTSAPYVLARGRALDNAGEYRKALMDYLTYDTLMHFNATPDFYYIKYKCEMQLHQYQLALQDIAHAIVLNRQEPTYYAELASLQLRVNKADDAIKTCDMALQLAPEYTDLYIIKGIAQCESNLKTEGLATLQKAKDLGDARADELIAKYQK